KSPKCRSNERSAARKPAGKERKNDQPSPGSGRRAGLQERQISHHPAQGRRFLWWLLGIAGREEGTYRIPGRLRQKGIEGRVGYRGGDPAFLPHPDLSLSAKVGAAQHLLLFPQEWGAQAHRVPGPGLGGTQGPARL